MTRYRAPGTGTPDFQSAGGLYDFQLTGTLVPEPSTMAMFGSGALAACVLAAVRLRVRRRVAA